ncbi:uncharacterized protein LOC136093756 [Hydra vulgaris]|uniref:uncharacterized protein LOC136093756 n=1 Tax=Hydra vulgaris TaxID=6087 RepID=UPI0032EA4642
MNTDVFDREKIADMFNEFFINVGKDLAEKIIPGIKTFKSFLKKTHSIINEFEISSDETNKSPGIDEINASGLKSVFDIIESPLLTLFNLSLKTGVFLDKLKIARVVPIYKNGDDSLAFNYRPKSILSCISKLLECVMFYIETIDYTTILKQITFCITNNLVFTRVIQHIMQ